MGICTLVQGETLDPSAHFRTLEHSEGLSFLSCLLGEKDLPLGPNAKATRALSH